MSTTSLTIDGLDGIDAFNRLDAKVLQAAYRAINRTAQRTRTIAADTIRKQVAFPASYLSPSQGRFYIKRQASSASLESEISAQVRATSLARFARPGPKGKGVFVEIQPGMARWMPNAFFLKMRGFSKTDTDEGRNLIAIRLKPGQRPRGSRTGARELSPGLWILYGPSVDQAFISASKAGVAQDLTPSTLQFLRSEFIRLLELDL